MSDELYLPDGRPLRVLTVRQPWAWCIFHGKGVENRTGNGWGFRGAVAIHAGSSGWSKRGQLAEHVRRLWWEAGRAAGYSMCQHHPIDGPFIRSPHRESGYLFHHTVTERPLTPLHPGVPAEVQLHLGAVLGVVELTDAHQAIDVDCECVPPWAESTYQEAGGRRRYAEDIQHLVLDNPVPFARPLYTTSIRGGLGLRKPTPDARDEIAVALAEASEADVVR